MSQTHLGSKFWLLKGDGYHVEKALRVKLQQCPQIRILSLHIVRQTGMLREQSSQYVRFRFLSHVFGKLVFGEAAASEATTGVNQNGIPKFYAVSRKSSRCVIKQALKYRHQLVNRRGKVAERRCLKMDESLPKPSLTTDCCYLQTNTRTLSSLKRSFVHIGHVPVKMLYSPDEYLSNLR